MANKTNATAPQSPARVLISHNNRAPPKLRQAGKHQELFFSSLSVNYPHTEKRPPTGNDGSSRISPLSNISSHFPQTKKEKKNNYNSNRVILYRLSGGNTILTSVKDESNINSYSFGVSRVDATPLPVRGYPARGLSLSLRRGEYIIQGAYVFQQTELKVRRARIPSTTVMRGCL